MVPHHITYLNSTETVETGEPLSTDETTSLFESTAVFASVSSIVLCGGKKFTLILVKYDFSNSNHS
jgi:hypothetical protein